MRTIIRRSALSALLLLTTPLAATLTTTSALAQQDKITELARAKFVDGVAAMNAKRYAEARDLFLQAYAMKRHPAVLLNLGLAEIRTGDADVGANHLQQFLREFDQAKPEQRDTANKAIAEAKKTSAYVIAIVDTDGATVMVDGQVVGQSPLTEPYFVKAGEHDVEAAGIVLHERHAISEQVPHRAHPQYLLHAKALEKRPCVCFNGNHLGRAGLLQHVRMPSLKRSNLEDAAPRHTAHLGNGPRHSRVLKQGCPPRICAQAAPRGHG
jgi:tetratricopeptide (TPR) repeat protein